ncbi:DUF3110 domain containing protein [Nitzschia inconspicua]|uniref:DUF3110 domain containing protein n=1 Tax=Nitzschia inconspicua TaxID=303405 RepID=A0A9K3LQ47_9STRA|nr:DUF3110 domain containing protein [Nitzschia inconspicua]
MALRLTFTWLLMLSSVAGFSPIKTFLSTKIGSALLPARNSPAKLFLQSLQEQENQYLELASQNSGAQPDVVYILMYNQGTDQEGVHTTEYPRDGSGNEVILGFEELGDCAQFAMALKMNPDFPLDPVPTPAPFQQMQASVGAVGLSIMVVPQINPKEDREERIDM